MFPKGEINLLCFNSFDLYRILERRDLWRNNGLQVLPSAPPSWTPKSLAYISGRGAGNKRGSTGSWFYVNHELQKNRSRFPLHASPPLTASLAVRLTSSPTMPLGQKRWISCPCLPGLSSSDQNLKDYDKNVGKYGKKKSDHSIMEKTRKVREDLDFIPF